MVKNNISHSTDLEKEYKKKIEELNDKIAQLDSENFQLRNLIDTFPGDIYWKNANGVWTGMNTRCAQSLHRMGFIKEGAKTEIIGKTDYQLFDQKSADIYRKNDLEVMERRKEISQEEEAHLPSGEKIMLLSTKSPLWDKEGHVAGIIGNTIDITYLKKIEIELKKAKEASETANHAKTEFLANMRHDIRTPLSGIVGFSEILKSESTEPHIKKYAEGLVASSHALLSLMDEVLEAIRVSSGTIPLQKRKFNLTATLDHIMALYLAKAQEKKLNLSLILDKELPRFVIGDKIRVHRIILELVGNALNFTDAGHVTIAVTLAKRKHRDLVIKFSVTDSGIGIPKEKQQEIYVQFNRLSPSYQGVYKGAGLGLYLVKHFTDELHGEIYVESELRKGTCFTCLIPMQEPLLNDASGIDTSEYLKTKVPDLTPLKDQLNIDFPRSENNTDENTQILLVEDNIIAQSVAKALLSPLSCHVDVASNGNEALVLSKKNHYDLIFMDIGLGDGMDGYEVTRQIRNQSDKMPHIPIVALTAHAGDENKQRCIEAGMDEILNKPLTQTHAINILKKFIPARQVALSKSLAIKQELPDHDDELFHLEQFAILDTEQALKNCGNLTMLVQLLILVVKDVPVNLEDMKKAYKNQNYSLVEHIAHKIKGSAVYVGTTRMKYACQYVERYWKTGQVALFDKLYVQAINTIEETCIYINNWLNKHKNQ